MTAEGIRLVSSNQWVWRVGSLQQRTKKCVDAFEWNVVL